MTAIHRQVVNKIRVKTDTKKNRLKYPRDTHTYFSLNVSFKIMIKLILLNLKLFNKRKQ